MLTREYCRYIRTYSELEGLQHAHTTIYCAAAAAQGVVLELRSRQGDRLDRRTVLARCSFARAMQLMRFLCENGVGSEQWLEVLADAGVSVCPLQTPGMAEGFPEIMGENLDFCAICPV